MMLLKPTYRKDDVESYVTKEYGRLVLNFAEMLLRIIL